MNGIISKLIIATMALLLVILTGCKQTTGDPDTFYYVHSDHLNVPTVVTNKDKTVVWEGHRKPFGETEITVATIEQPFRLPGQYYDSETGLHYNLMRDYDPRLGRYVQSDPIGLAGGMSTYGYAGQNPVTNYDPNGEFFFLLFAPVLGLTTTTAFVFDLTLALSLIAGVNNANVVLSNGSEWDWEDSSQGSGDPYGGYDQTDENDAVNLANNLTGYESCDLIEEAKTALKNRIRGRQENCDDHFGGDEGHLERIEILKAALEKLENASCVQSS